MINVIKISSIGVILFLIKYVYNIYMFILFFYCYVDIKVDFYFIKKILIDLFINYFYFRM